MSVVVLGVFDALSLGVRSVSSTVSAVLIRGAGNWLLDKEKGKRGGFS